MLALDQLIAVQGGGYISTLKVFPVLLILLAWAKLLAWADEDAQAAHLPKTALNLANLSGMVLAFALFFVVPTFILGFLALLVVAGIEAGIYLSLRKKRVGLHDLDKQFKVWLNGFKGKPKEESSVGKVVLFGKDGKPLPIPEVTSPDRVGFDVAQLVLGDPLFKEAQQIDFAPEGEGMALKYVVDNFTHAGPSMDRTAGAAGISYLKWAAGMNIEDRRKPQSATLKVNRDKIRNELKIQTAGTTAGEFLRVLVDPKGRHSFKLADLGLTETELENLQKLIKQEKGGIVLLSAPKGHGLTSLFYAILRAHDVFLEHGHTVERDQEQDVEGITQNKLPANASAGEEFKMVDWVISQDPDLFGVSKVEDPKTGTALIDYAKRGKRVYVCMRANSTFEALEQWKRLVGGSSAASMVKMVVNGRVLRKLCEACKEGFTPDPATLKKLNISADHVATLYKAREMSLRDSKGKTVPCEFCHDLRFKGRTGIYEMLTVDDEVRQTLDAGKKLDQVFRKQRGRYLQEEALELVKKGETSLQEVARVLKPAADSAPTAAAPARAKPSSTASVRNS